ncbi:MAG TPA: DUF6249 domain-containing protein [bacterium]|nr:DUF6249 domain-containing protein [bacterium]
MTPSSILNSFNGTLAIFLIFGLPIVAVVGAFVVAITGSQKRHRERMKMIEQGMMPPPHRRRTGNFYALLIIGAILLAFGLALVFGQVAQRGNDFTGGFIFGFIGLAMLACFAIIRAARRREQPDKTDYGTPAPPPLPPQP